MTKTFSIFGSLALLVATLLGIQMAFGSVTSNTSVQPTDSHIDYTFFTATTTTATSTNLSGGGGYFKIAGAKKVSALFGRGGITAANTGTSTFTIQYTTEATSTPTWYDFGRFLSATTTATAPFLYFGSEGQVALGQATGNGTSTIVVALDFSKIPAYAIRCIVNETVDGEHTCRASVEN